ncbi:ABC transporter permease [Streptomyces mangrovisoli]|uniref:ABC transporter permease n=1 Tax=Streptomyces mangrovisoli TaxID=1428628 RepID=A0A1J4NQ49_9ACTN|nr:ABC transporter permease [Streptomyces mangrovisoli]
MGGGALGRVVRSGVGRRRVQTLVIAVATMMAVAAAVVAGSLMVATDAPFDHAFARQHGPHLTATFDPDKATTAQLAATRHLEGVTASAGPFPSTTISPVDGNGGHLPSLTLVGRADPGGTVDELDLKSGRWPRKEGEVVLSDSFSGDFLRLGSTLKSSADADAQTLTVVGFALSAGQSADMWATPGQVRALASDGAALASQMLYRFDSAGTKSRMANDRKKIAAALPAGALTGATSWLDTKHQANRNASVTIPFLFAFGVLGLVMSVIIVGSVISGSVGTGLRRIGILKAIGFTPREVVRAYVAQALIPAAAGIALGVVLGNLLALPLLADTESVYGTVSLSVAWWVDVLVPACALLVVGVAALVPALRAGRLHTIEAIAVGRAPRTARGRWAHRAAGRLPLPRPVTYGLASPFAHPVRALAMVLAVTFGTVAATFAVGLTQSLNAVGAADDPQNRADVTAVTGASGGGGPQRHQAPAGPQQAPAASGAGEQTPADPAAVRAAIAAQSGTASYYGTTEGDATVPGVSGTVRATLYQGDSRPGAYEMIHGHWLSGRGQVVVPTAFLERTGTEIGDSVRVTFEKETVSLRIVGEAFDSSNDGMDVHADLASFTKAAPTEFHIEVKSGVTPAAYATKLSAAVRPLGGDAFAESVQEGGGMIVILEAMAALLTLMLVSVAGLGVLNSVVLDTRERVHDLGVCKAVGMSPRQTVGYVLASVVGIGVVGGLVGVPAGFALHGYVLPVMGRAADTGLPPSVLDVYGTPELVLLGVAGALVAVLGALGPAGWAARVRTATALRTE